MMLECLELLRSKKTSSRKNKLLQLPSEAECEGLSCSGHRKRNAENCYTCQLTDLRIQCLSSNKRHQSAIFVILLILSLISSC